MKEGILLAKSKSKPKSSSSAEELRKVVKELKHEMENLPGAYLWRKPILRGAIIEDNVSEDEDKDEDEDDMKYIRWRIDCLKAHISVRKWWLDLFENDPLTKSMGWDLNRLWRFSLVIGWRKFNAGISKELKPLEYEQEITSRDLIPDIWEYMKNLWEEEDKDVTLEEVTRNFHLFIQIEENGRKKKILAKAAKAAKEAVLLKKCHQRRSSSYSLRIRVLKKQARLHCKKKLKPEPKPPADNDDDFVKEEPNKPKPNPPNDDDNVVKDDHIRLHRSKKLKHNTIPLPTSKLKPTIL